MRLCEYVTVECEILYENLNVCHYQFFWTMRDFVWKMFKIFAMFLDNRYRKRKNTVTGFKLPSKKYDILYGKY